MFLILLILISLLFVYLKTRSRFYCDVPGPKPYPIVGNAFKFFVDEPLEVLLNEAKRWGKIYKLTLGSDLFVMITDPVDAEVILSSSKYNSKAISYKFLSVWLKDGLITSKGDLWYRHRKFLTPTFHFKILESSVEIMHKNADTLMKQLQSEVGGNEFNIQNFIDKCSLDIICECAMNVQINSQISKDALYLHAVKSVTEITTKRMFQLWLQPEILYKLSGYSRTFNKSLQIIESLSKKVILSERQSLTNQKDKNVAHQTNPDLNKKLRVPFLQWMLTESDFSDDEIHAEVMSFMFAGYDTTTTGLSFCIHQLAKYPDVQEKAYQEIKEVFVDDNNCPRIQELNNMKYLECVIKETMRVLPPVPMIGRMIHEPLDLPSGYKLPAGTQINILTYGMHHSAELFPDPEAFCPERFMNNRESYHPFAYIPFSAGPRNCIGQKFAILELKIVLGILLKTYQILPPCNSKPLILRSELILRSKDGIPVRLVQRNI